MPLLLTFDRRDLLRACLRAIAHQTVSCDGVIVVDNGSSDGTADMLCAEFSSVEVCRLRTNRWSRRINLFRCSREKNERSDQPSRIAKACR